MSHETVTRVVRSYSFPYRVTKVLPDGHGGVVERDVVRRARCGDVIEVRAVDAGRGDALGALAPVGAATSEDAPAAAGADLGDLSNAEIKQLAASLGHEVPRRLTAEARAALEALIVASREDVE